jgi:hypothetical protein
MNLINQFQGVIGSFFIGFFSLMVIHPVTYIWKRIIVINFILILISSLILTISYYLFLTHFTYGIFNIFFIISLFGGMIIYFVFYSYHFNLIYQNIDRLIKLKKQRKVAIIKKKKRSEKS